MISGRVKEAEAVVTLLISGPAGDESTVEAVIDSGFTDHLTLPSSVINALRLPLLGSSVWQLADGRAVTMDGFVVTVQWHDSPRKIVALATEGGPLIGMALLLGSRLTMEVVADGAVMIDQLSEPCSSDAR